MPRRLLTWCLASVLFFGASRCRAPETPAGPKPNYDLAANWTAQKVGRLVFDTTRDAALARDGDRVLVSVSDRARDASSTSSIRSRGARRRCSITRRWPPTLTSITREPYDAQHLPFTTVKFVRKRRGVPVRRPGAARCRRGQAEESPSIRPMLQAAARQGGQDPSDDDAVDPQQQGQRGRGGASAAAHNRRERGRCTSVRHGDRQRRPPRRRLQGAAARRAGRRRRRTARRSCSRATTTSS